MESFYRSFFTPQTTLLKRKLKPFCLGHYILLKALDNPFVTIKGDIHANDLIIAIKVCSSEYPFEPDLKLTFYEKFMMFYLSRSQTALLKYAKLFQRYLNDNHNCPEYWQDTSENSYVKTLNSAPVELTYVVNLMKHGISHIDAWSMSMGYLSWLNATIQEMNGIERTFTDPLEDIEAPEDLSELTNDEIYKLALKDLGEKRAKEFMEMRQKNGL